LSQLEADKKAPPMQWALCVLGVRSSLADFEFELFDLLEEACIVQIF